MNNASSTFDISPASQTDKNVYEPHESTINFVNSHTGPLSNRSDEYYLGTYQDYSKEPAMNPHHLEHATPHTGLGLSYQKFREQYNLGIYQAHLVSPAADTFTSAPAAFGMYQGSPNIAEYPSDHHFSQTHYSQSGFDGYFYDPQQHYPTVDGSDPWMTHPAAAYQNDASIMEFMDSDKNYYLGQSMHVETSALDGNSSNGFHSNFLHESGQTITSSSTHTPKPQKDDLKKTSRSAGQPTNIVSNGKMDRKTLKRLRNRVSASRCRIKKKEWINEMEDESNAINSENKLLMKKISALEDSISNMKATLAQN